MMTRGRTPKPTAIKRLEGNPGKRRLNAEEPQPSEPLEKPDGLSDDASAEWDRAVRAMPAGLYTAADGPALAVYCKAWVTFVAASETLEAEGLFSTGSQGQLTAHPAVAIVAKQSEIILRATDRLGMTPAARTRLTMPAAKDAGKFDGLLGGAPLRVVTSSAPKG